MMRFPWFAFICLVFLAPWPASVSSQGDQPILESLFDDPGEVSWSTEFRGKLDGIFPLEMEIGSDGQVYRGRLYVGNEETPSYLMGRVAGNTIRLEQIDFFGKPLGMVEGKLVNNRFAGTWKSRDGQHQYDINLLDKKLIELKPFKPAFHKYKVRLNNNTTPCYIVIESPDLVSGIFFTGKNYARLLGNCSDKNCKSIELFALDGDVEGSKLVLTVDPSGSARAQLVNNTGTVANGSAELAEVLELTVLTGSKNVYLIDYAVVNTGHVGFDTYMASFFDQWKNRVTAYCATNIEDIPATHWSVRASAWMDVYTLNEHAISGLCTFYDPESAEYISKAFAYSLDDDEPITLDELSRNSSELDKVLRERTPDSKTYTNAVLTSRGFMMRTNFNPVTGSAGCLVPYSDVESYIKKRALLNKLTD